MRLKVIQSYTLVQSCFNQTMHAKSTHGKSCDVESIPSQNHASLSMKFQVLAVLLQN